MRRYLPAGALLLAYLLIGLLYALYTPPWQVPDEPAHYNYIRALAEGRGFPVMEPGDYDQDYLGRLTAERFPPHLPVDVVEYEDHQPPLYYLLATPFFWVFDGAMLSLRLFSLALSAVGVLLIALLTRELCPAHPRLAWLSAGLVAFNPQFVALMTGVNNDALTLALLWLWVWLAVRYLRGATSPWLLSLVLGALLVTKSTGYAAVPLTAVVLYWRGRRETWSWQQLLREAVRLGGPALLLGALWWGRNAAVYGWPDVMGLQRHDEVVVGQPRTADWIARDGLWPFLAGAAQTTFRSFWGQFGWMGVVLDARLYDALGLLSLLLVWGTLAHLLTTWRACTRHQREGALLLGALAGLAVGLYLYYNLGFVQHQGRYLFTALPVLGVGGAAGLRTLARRELAWGTAAALAVSGGLLALVGLLRGDLPLWSLALIGATAGALAMTGWLPDKHKVLAGTALLAALALLDVVCLFGFIVPQLRF